MYILKNINISLLIVSCSILLANSFPLDENMVLEVSKHQHSAQKAKLYGPYSPNELEKEYPEYARTRRDTREQQENLKRLGNNAHEKQTSIIRPESTLRGGGFDMGYKADQHGREASFQYNQNLFKSSDGRGSIDAYAQGSRNFDYNRNNFGGGIMGRWNF